MHHPQYLIVRKIPVPPGITIDKKALIESLPVSVKVWLLKSHEEKSNPMQFYFMVKNKDYSFLITAVYFGSTIEITIQNEKSVSAPFCTVRSFYIGVLNSFVDYVNSLVQAEELIKQINKGDGKENK